MSEVNLQVKEAMMKMIGHIQANPDASIVPYSATTELLENVRCSAKVRNLPEVIIDEPPVLAGQDAGLSPVEHILIALGTCQEIMYAAYASVMDIPLDSVKVNLKANLDVKGLFGLDPAVPAGFTDIAFETTLDSPADNATLLKLVEAAESNCPVMDMLTRKVPVTGNVTINGVDMANIQSDVA